MKNQTIETTTVVGFSEKQKELLYNFIKSFNKADSSTKELFCTLLGFYKGGYSQTAIMLEIGNISNEANQGAELLAKLRKINDLAHEAYKNKLLLKIAYIHFYNIEKTVNLFKAIKAKHSKESREGILKDVRETLFNCYDKADTKVAYNDKVRETIITLRKKYNIIEVDEVKTISNLKTRILKLNEDERRELMEALRKSLTSN